MNIYEFIIILKILVCSGEFKAINTAFHTTTLINKVYPSDRQEIMFCAIKIFNIEWILPSLKTLPPKIKISSVYLIKNCAF